MSSAAFVSELSSPVFLFENLRHFLRRFLTSARQPHLDDGIEAVIEKTVVDGYKKIEKTFVDGYTKIEDKFVDQYLTRGDETVEEAKARLKKEQEER